MLPSGDGGTPTPPTPAKRRNPWTWPLVALVALLLLVLVGTIIALVAAPGPAPTKSPSQTSTAHSTPPSTPTPTNTLVTLAASEVQGHTKSYVQALLTSRNLVPNLIDGDPASTAAQVGTAEDVMPVGNLTPGQTVTVTFWTAVPPPPAPAAPTATGGPTYAPGSTVTVSWVAYLGCPSGQNLSGYNVTVTNGTATQSNPLPAGTLSEPITVGTTGSTGVTYTAVCGTGPSAVQTPASPSLSLAIATGP